MADYLQTFHGSVDFEACRKAEAWCRAHGFSVGHMQRGSPRGLLYGHWDIQKWRNLNRAERRQLDGVMYADDGSMRTGPVIIKLFEPRNSNRKEVQPPLRAQTADPLPASRV